jgi:copper homeostasis protein (lipoprotein)
MALMGSAMRSMQVRVPLCVLAAVVLSIGCTSAPGPRPEPARRAVDEGPRRLLGLYRYSASAASFFDCASGDQFPVAPGGAGAALQAAYAAARAVPGEPKLASVDARIVMHAAEPGAPRAALRIERLVALSPQSQCAAPPR